MFVTTALRYWLAFSMLCVLSSVPTTAQVSAAPIIRLDSGSLSGTQFGDSARQTMFLGIPYAAPPVGDLRWEPPAAVKDWKGARKADAFAPACPQPENSVQSQIVEAKELSQELPYY